MAGSFRFVAAIALGAILAGCAGSPAYNDSGRLHQQAQADLARWSDAVAAAGGSSFVPVGELTGQIGDWEESVGNNNKPALMAGLVEAAIDLPQEKPPDGIVRWNDGLTESASLISAPDALARLKADAGAGSCPECTPLRIVAARLSTAEMRTSRGPAQVPVWEFSLDGTAVRVTRLATAGYVQVKPPPWDPNNPPVGLSIMSATGRADGRELTVTFTGAPDGADKPCGADYTAEAVESDLAIVVIVIEHANGLPVPCTAVGAMRTVTAHLSSPLGKRAVLEVQQGLPVEVLPS